MKKNKKSLLSRLFDSNVFLLILAFVLSFVSWIAVSFVSDNNTKTLTINDIPVTISLPETENDYTYFLSDATASTIDQTDDLTSILKPVASAEVKGNPIVVGSVKPENIQITGKINQTDSGSITPQVYTVTLTYERVGTIANYTINSISPNTLKVYVDKETTSEFDITNNTKLTIDDENKYVSTTLSENKVSVTGPESLVNKISSVEVHGNISENTTITKDLLFYDETGDEIDTTYLRPDIDSVEVTTSSILAKKRVSLDVVFKNKPEDVSTVPTIEPSTVTIVGPDEKVNKLSKLSLGTIDYSELDNSNNKIEKSITAPDECKVIADSDNETAPSIANVSVDLAPYDGKDIVTNITYSDDDYYFMFSPGSVTVKVCGQREEIAEISSADITITPDFSDKLDDIESGTTVSLQNIPLKITLSDDYTESWISGKYSVEVKVTKK